MFVLVWTDSELSVHPAFSCFQHLFLSCAPVNHSTQVSPQEVRSKVRMIGPDLAASSILRDQCVCVWVCVFKWVSQMSRTFDLPDVIQGLSLSSGTFEANNIKQIHSNTWGFLDKSKASVIFYSYYTVIKAMSIGTRSFINFLVMKIPTWWTHIKHNTALCIHASVELKLSE